MRSCVRLGCGALLVGALFLLWAAPALAAETRLRFRVPEGVELLALWSDDADRMYAASDRQLYVLRRGLAPVVLPLGWEPSKQVHLAGARAGEAAVVVAWNERGQVARFAGEQPSGAGTLPGSPQRCFAVVEPGGTFYCAHKNGESLVWPAGEAGFMGVPPPAPGLQVGGATLGPGGGLLLVPEAEGPSGRVAYQLLGGTWRPMPLPVRDLSKEVRQAVWQGAYYSPLTDTLWVGAEPDRLLALSPARNTAFEHRVPEQEFREGPTLATLRGTSVVVEGGRRELLWLWGGEQLFVYTEGRFYSFVPIRTRTPGPIRAVTLDAGEGSGYVAATDGVDPVSIDVPPWGRGAEPMRRERRSRFRWTALPMLVLGLGPVWRLGTGPVPLAPGMMAPRSPDAEFALDISAGLSVGGRAGSWEDSDRFLWITPELGYSYAKTSPGGTHLFTVGTGVGYGSRMFFASYAPRFVAGNALGLPGTALGVRNGLAFNILYGSLGLEVAHQYLHFTAPDLMTDSQHDVRVMFRINAGHLFALVIMMTRMR